MKALTSSDAFSAFKIIRRGDKISHDEMIFIRNQAFVNQAKYCFHHIPFYKQYFNSRDISSEVFEQLSDVKYFPVLTKEMLRSNQKDFLSDEISTMKCSTRRSGGTTGEPIKTYLDSKASALEVFSYFRGLEWMGWKPDMSLVKIFGGSLGFKPNTTLREQILNKVLKSHFIPAFEISKDTSRKYLDTIESLHKPVLIGYASAIYNLAYYSRLLNKVPKKIELAITTSEMLPSEWSAFISETFECKVRSYYGCGEINSIGYQLEAHDYYLVPDEHIIVESWQEDNSYEKNSLLITQLYNKAQPLIRYLNGDLGTIEGTEGQASKNKSKILELLGRSADTFFRKDGTRVSSILGTYSIQKSLIPVRKYQYIQNVLGQIDFLYDPEYDDLTELHKKQIHDIVNYVMNEVTQVNFKRTKDFVVSSSGKYRITVCNLVD